jgi:peptide/nickel transport system permease protein
MLRFAAKRLAWAIPSVLLMSAVLYFSIGGLLGSPAIFLLGIDATPNSIAELNTRLGFDRPIYVQYLDWLSHAALGNLGTSYITKQPVSEMILERLPVTLEIGLLAILLPAICAVVVNTWAMGRRYSRLLIDGFAIAGITLPNFILGTFLIYGFSVYLRVLPSVGWSPWSDGLEKHILHIILPVVTLSGYLFGAITIIYRSELVSVSAQPFARVAKAKGASRARVAFRHVMPNAVLPVVTFVGLSLGQMLGGAIVTETLFSVPGLGSLFVDSIMGRDFPLMLAMGTFMIAAVVMMNALTDIAYTFLNPQIRIS